MNLSACRACGCSAFDLHLMVPVGYCAGCVVSGQAAYDVADRAGDRVAMDAAMTTTMVHADYPHDDGTLYDCAACESECFCTVSYVCIYCADGGE